MEEPISMDVATPGGNPVAAVPGSKHKLPVRTVKPELVMVEEALTAQSLELVPRLRARAWWPERRVRARMRGRVVIGDMVGEMMELGIRKWFEGTNDGIGDSEMV